MFIVQNNVDDWNIWYDIIIDIPWKYCVGKEYLSPHLPRKGCARVDTNSKLIIDASIFVPFSWIVSARLYKEPARRRATNGPRRP